MKITVTVYRQDGSAVDLDEKDAALWVKKGLATEDNPKPSQVKAQLTPKDI